MRCFLAANTSFSATTQAACLEASLIEAGIIDSTGVLELVGFLEETFGIRIGDNDLVPENLDTIDNIVSYVERNRAATSTP